MLKRNTTVGTEAASWGWCVLGVRGRLLRLNTNKGVLPSHRLELSKLTAVSRSSQSPLLNLECGDQQIDEPHEKAAGAFIVGPANSLSLTRLPSGSALARAARKSAETQRERVSLTACLPEPPYRKKDGPMLERRFSATGSRVAVAMSSRSVRKRQCAFGLGCERLPCLKARGVSGSAHAYSVPPLATRRYCRPSSS